MTPLLVALVVAGPLPDGDTANPFLVQAKELYEQLDFEKCQQRIKQASSWKGSSVRDLRDIELYGALCAFNLGQKAEAAERFKLALRIDEDVELPEFASPKAVRLFLYVKKKLRQPTVAPLPDEDLPPDTAAQKSDKPPVEAEAVTVTSPSALSQYAVPIGLGAGTLVLTGLGIGLGVDARSLEAQARTATFESDFLRLRGQAQGSAVAADIAYAFAAGLLVATVLVLLLQR